MSVSRNTLLNVAGAAVPLIVSLITVPAYLHVIGEARYGLMAITWLVLGYFGALDLGLSTATANSLAKHREADPIALPAIFVTALLTNAAIGSIFAVLFFVAAPVLIAQSTTVAPDLRAEITAVLPWLALGIPLATIGSVFGGVLTSHERFGQRMLVSTSGFVLFQVVPLLVAMQKGGTLQILIPAAIIARAVPVAVSCFLAQRLVPLSGARYDRTVLASLLTYGGWVMVTSIVLPVLVSVDQLAIVTWLGSVAVAHYAIVYNLAVRLLLVPQALTDSLFPRLSSLREDDAKQMAAAAHRSVLLIMTVLVVPAILIIRPFLTIWISPSFAAIAWPVAVILFVSMWINALAYVPYVYLQARGRPDQVAKIHLFEIIPFFACLYVAVHHYGLTGAAWAWGFRILLDTILLSRASGLKPATPLLFLTAISFIGAAGVFVAFMSPGAIISIGLAIVAGLSLLAWSIANGPDIRLILDRVVRRLGFRFASPNSKAS